MIVWLLKSIGVSDEILQHLDQAQLAVQHPLVLGAGLVLLVPLAMLIYHRQARSLTAAPGWVTTVLTITRVLVLAILLATLSSPYLKLDYRLEQKPIVALLFDHSQSMQLPAGPFDEETNLVRIARAAGYQTAPGKVGPETRQALNHISRGKLAQTVAQAAWPVLGKLLAEKFEIRYAAFARDLHPLAVDRATGAFPEPANPGGSATHLGDAIAQVLDEAGGQPVAGVVIFSDGQNTGGQSPAEVARRAATLHVPLFTVPPGSAAVVPDVAVVDVSTSGPVAVGDNARVTAAIQATGLDGKTATVQLLEGTTVLDAKELVLRSGEQQQVELTFAATRAGTRYLTVNVPPLPEEPAVLRANNADTAVVRVSRNRIRVLYLDGPARWDFRFLKNAMRRDHGLGGRFGRDPDIFLEAELRRRAPEQIAAALPATVADFAQYHTVLLGDVSPHLLRPEVLDHLAEAVRTKGVGLIVLAGPQAMPHLFPAPFQELLPVRLHPRAAGLAAPVYRPFQLELAPQGAIQDMMQLDEDRERNQAIWARMPPYYWCAAADSLAAGATVLAWNPDVGGQHGNLPLIAYQYAGDGKVLFVGTDSTWLWRQNVGDRFFYRFWGQAIRFVARHDAANKEASDLEVHPLHVSPGEPAQLELLAFDAAGAPRSEHKLTVNVFDGSSLQPLALVADHAEKGRFHGAFTPPRPGDYRFSFDTGEATAPVDARLRVTAAAEEFRQPGLNRGALELLATLSGGKLVELPDLASIPPQLQGAAKLTPVHCESTVWDNWLTLVVLVLVYSLDVGVRRFRGLA